MPDPVITDVETAADSKKRFFRNPFAKTVANNDEESTVKSVKDKTKTALAYVGAGSLVLVTAGVIAKKRVGDKTIDVEVTPPSVDITTSES